MCARLGGGGGGGDYCQGWGGTSPSGQLVGWVLCQQMGEYGETARKSKGGVPKGVIFIIYLLHKYIVK